MDKNGPLFGEYITTEKIKRRGSRGSNDRASMRIFLVPVFLAAALILIGARLFFLQVAQGKYYRNLSDTNRIKTVIIHAPRGTIFDRNKKPLVFNVPGFREKVGEKTKLIGRNEALTLLAKGNKNLEIDSLREYPYKESLTHVLGYLGQISEEELKQKENSTYRSGDLVGKMGIEKEYEQFLKGVDGKELVEIDSMGKPIRTLGKTDPQTGRDLTLTIDGNLARKTSEAMKNVKRGAVIASTPKGEILTLFSKPSFDPNLFTLGKDYKVASNASHKDIEDVILDPNQPFLNRAISGTYPPGSTFKIVTAAAGLEDHIIDTNYSVNDTGVIKIGEFSFANWYFTGYGRTEGAVNVVKGLKRSNDIFFYKLAEKVGVEKLSAMARQFGMGKLLGIDLEGEEEGNVPSDEWKKKVIGEPWFLGDTYHYGIGQGYLLTTPLQVNSWTQTVAAGGTLYKPHILKDLGYQVLNKGIVGEDSIKPIRQGMIEACAQGGVAYPLFDFKVKN